MSNNLTTQAYTIKRLRDSGYNVHRMDSLKYSLEDARKWTILIGGGSSNVFMTCYKDGKFSFYDGGFSIKSNMKINTDSVEVLIQDLNAYGIIHKHRSYCEVLPYDPESEIQLEPEE